MAAQALADTLTDAQARALLACVAQDPNSDVCSSTGRTAPVDCDGRSQGPLLELDLLAWSAGFDALTTLTPLGREVAALLGSK